jgi:hypothetical protein
MRAPGPIKRLLVRWMPSRSIGIMVEDRRIAICILTAGANGPHPVVHEVHDCGDEEPKDVLTRLLEPWLAPKRSKVPALAPWVQVGIPNAHVFQAIVPITQANRNGNAQAYFLEAVQATNVRAEDRIIELIRLDLNKQAIACVASTPTGRVSTAVQMLSDAGLRVGLAEPAAAALFRAGSFHARAPRGSKLCVRFFLGEQQAVGVVGAGACPLFWHEFALEPGQETASILAAYTTLWMLGRNGRITLPIDTVVVHGRPDLRLTQEPQEFQRRTGARLMRCDAPGCGPEAAAMGLAMADPLSDEPRLDLARELEPAPTIRDVFPWKELTLHGALLGGVSLVLLTLAADAGTRLRMAQADMATIPWVKGMDQAKLDGEKKALEERIKAVTAFRGSRVAWSVPLRTIAASAPANTVITALSGDAEIQATGGTGTGKAKKQLVVSFETPMAEDGSLPRELDGFLAALREEASIKRHFPLITVTGLRADPVRKGQAPTASYSVICLPKADKAPAPAARPAAGKSKG